MNNLTTLITGEINLFFLLILILSLIFIITTKRSSSERPPIPPGPYPWPIVGNIFQMRKQPHVTLANLARLHGPIMSLRLGSQLLVVGSSPAAAAEILKTHDRMLSGRHVPSAIQFKGSKLHNQSLSFFGECDDEWKRVRSIYRAQLFSSKSLEAQVKLREKKVMDMVKYVGSKEGEIVKIKEMVFATALNILSNIVLSMDFIDYEGKGVGEGMRGYIRGFAELGGTPQLSDLFPIMGRWDFQSMYKKLIDILERMSANWVDIVKERREGRVDGLSQRDFMDALIGNGFKDEQINPLLLELFSAGTESTSATSEWAFVELIRNQEAMQKLRDELEKVVGRDIIRESNLPQLPYLEACLKEILRLHPPGPLLLPHRAVETCEVMGYTIPKDSQVLVNMWAIGRDPTIWDDPLSFKPERFLISKLDYKGQDFEYIPFGSGRRICPGQPLASRAVPLIVASLIHTFDWCLPHNMDSTQIDMSEKLDITMQKEETLCVIPKLRKY